MKIPTNPAVADPKLMNLLQMLSTILFKDSSLSKLYTDIFRYIDVYGVIGKSSDYCIEQVLVFRQET